MLFINNIGVLIAADSLAFFVFYYKNKVLTTLVDPHLMTCFANNYKAYVVVAACGATIAVVRHIVIIISVPALLHLPQMLQMVAKGCSSCSS